MGDPALAEIGELRAERDGVAAPADRLDPTGVAGDAQHVAHLGARHAEAAREQERGRLRDDRAVRRPPHGADQLAEHEKAEVAQEQNTRISGKASSGVKPSVT